jgi:hypothetical protein
MMGAVLGIPLPRLSRLLCRSRTVCGRSRRCRLAAFLAAFVGCGMTGMLALSGTAGLLAAAIILVDGRPGPALGFLFGYATVFVAFGDVVSLAFLLVGALG